MREAIYGWLRTLIGYYLIYSIVMNLIPGKQYRGYIKIFMGMMLAAWMITPIGRILHSDGELERLLQAELIKQEYSVLAEDDQLFQKSEDYVDSLYEDEVKTQIQSLARERGLDLRQIHVEFLQAETVVIRAITIQTGISVKSKQVECFREELAQLYGIDISSIQVR